MSLWVGMSLPHVLGPFTVPAYAVRGFPNPLLVASAELRGTKPDGTSFAWPATVTSTSAASIVTCALATGYLDQVGKYPTFIALAITGGGEVQIDNITLSVRSRAP